MNDRILTAEQAFHKVRNNTLLLLDIRRVDEWEKTGVAQGAVALTMDDDAFIEKLEKLTDNNKDRPVAVMCAAGGRSARVCQELHRQGYNFVYDVSEGMNGGPNGDGWLYKNMPTITYEKV